MGTPDTARFVWAIVISTSKSLTVRRPLTMASTPAACGGVDGQAVERRRRSTFGRWAMRLLDHGQPLVAWRTSTLSFCGFDHDADHDRVEQASTPPRSTSRWPLWRGSKLPG